MKLLMAALIVISILSLMGLVACGGSATPSGEPVRSSESNQQSQSSESGAHSEQSGAEGEHSSDSVSGAHSESGAEGEHGSDSASGAHSESGAEGEHSSDSASGAHSESGAEGEESGTQYGLDDTYDNVRAGARLIISYDADANAFTGVVENTTSRTLTRVRVEVHLSNGIELGPTTPVDLAPGESVNVTLEASISSFETWGAHPEVG